MYVYDPDTAAVQALLAAGAQQADTPAAVAHAAEVVFLSLPTPAISTAVALGENGVVHGSMREICGGFFNHRLAGSDRRVLRSHGDGAKAGLDPQVMLDVINVSSGRNSATQDKFPRSILPGTFDFGFGTGLAYKDVRLCIDEAEALGVPMVVGGAVREILAITNAMFGAQSDYTSMCRVVESWSQVEVRSK